MLLVFFCCLDQINELTFCSVNALIMQITLANKIKVFILSEVVSVAVVYCEDKFELTSDFSSSRLIYTGDEVCSGSLYATSRTILNKQTQK